MDSTRKATSFSFVNTAAERACVIAALGLALGSCRPSSPPVGPADLVLRNGRLLTIDRTRPEAQALAARGDRIVFVGADGDVAPYVGPSTRTIDLQGRLAIPGFIEAHGHFLELGESRLGLDLTGATSWPQIVEAVAGAAARARPGQWIVGSGWHQDKWTASPQPAVDGFPTHASLDAVSPDNPVMLTHASRHGVFVNARALTLSGITRATPDPPGGAILKDARGEPAGFLGENAALLVKRGAGEPAPTAEETATRFREALRLADQEAIAKGITTFHDAGATFSTIDGMRAAVDRGQLHVRLWVKVRASLADLTANLDRYKTVGYGHDMLTVRGIKEFADGAMGSRGAWLLEPYADKPESVGLPRPSMQALPQVARLAIEKGYQLAVHAIGDRANREVLNVFEAACKDAGRRGTDLRWRIEHAQQLSTADIPRVGALGVIASMQPVHATSDGPWIVERIGAARAEAGAYAWRALLASGAALAAGTDVPVEDIDPIANYYAAVTRRLPDGKVFTGGQRLSRMEALTVFTLGNAFAAFEEPIKGSLTAGKLADVTVLSSDITTVPDEEIRRATVVYTIVGGQVRYQGPAQ
jgi:predicted amidohydrolase YtcJ